MDERYFKMTIEYDGTDFAGWQVQPDRRTVQGELYRAFGELADGEIHIIGAGRTDAGVHAAGQVAGARFATKHSTGVLLRAANARLPGDIRIHDIEEVDAHFNARFDARSRIYQYVFIRRPSALWRLRYHAVPDELDIATMRRSLTALRGDHDFTSFSSSSDDGQGKTCTVIRAELIDLPPLLILEIEADRFLYHMVRIVAGTLLEIGRGKPMSIKEILDARNRTRAGPMAPSHGLYLKRIIY